MLLWEEIAGLSRGLGVVCVWEGEGERAREIERHAGVGGDCRCVKEVGGCVCVREGAHESVCVRGRYGVVTISRLLKIIGLFCIILSLS